jgi:hypothetical protein
MGKSGGGSIINIGSIGGMEADFSTAYSSSKWALSGLSGPRSFAWPIGESEAIWSSRVSLKHEVISVQSYEHQSIV